MARSAEARQVNERKAAGCYWRPWPQIESKGRYRLVMLVGSAAVKMPKLWRLLEGLRCSRREAQRWRSRRDDRLCCVRRCWLGGLLLVMDRAEPVSADEFWRLEEVGEIDLLIYSFDHETKADHALPGAERAKHREARRRPPRGHRLWRRGRLRPRAVEHVHRPRSR